MSLRVIAGTARGRRLKAVPGDTTRPVTDMVKEALFNILGEDVLDSDWWDLFAGTGAIGIEALSRGAAFVRFTDLNLRPVQVIRENVARCGFTRQSEILRADAFALLAAAPARQYDFIYVAPPQYREMWSRALTLIDAGPAWLAGGGCAIAQIHPREHDKLSFQNLRQVDERKYGSTWLGFFERVDEPA